MSYIEVTYLNKKQVVSQEFFGEVAVLDGGVLRVEYNDAGRIHVLILAPGQWLSVASV